MGGGTEARDLGHLQEHCVAQNMEKTQCQQLNKEYATSWKIQCPRPLRALIN